MFRLCLLFLLLQECHQQVGFSCRSYSPLDLRELDQMPGNCTDIVGHVWALSKNTSYDDMMRVFKSVRSIVGCVSIRNTDFPDLAFFENLENVTCRQNQVQATPMVDGFYIYNNRQLKKLGLKNTIKVDVGDGLKTGVGSAHADFCFSEPEKSAISPISPERLCSDSPKCYKLASKKKDGSQIPENCSVINWNIELEGNVKDIYLERLQSVKMIFGQIKITKHKKLEALELPNLQVITTPSAYPQVNAIHLEKCPKLKSIVLNDDFVIAGSCLGIFADGQTLSKANITLSPNSTYVETCCDCPVEQNWGDGYYEWF